MLKPLSMLPMNFGLSDWVLKFSKACTHFSLSLMEVSQKILSGFIKVAITTATQTKQGINTTSFVLSLKQMCNPYIHSRTIATSKFEPTYARRAFPCMDEPSYKSTFGVTLVRPKDDGYVAYSNMPEEVNLVDSFLF